MKISMPISSLPKVQYGGCVSSLITLYRTMNLLLIEFWNSSPLNFLSLLKKTRNLEKEFKFIYVKVSFNSKQFG